ncbi:hypothetical protein [Phormidium sp. CCY1219]|nr:hypothetical protein [Phormidium sp. CCY1219]
MNFPEQRPRVGAIAPGLLGKKRVRSPPNPGNFFVKKVYNN